MNSQIAILLVSLYVCLAYPSENIEYEIVEDLNGNQYYLIPHDDVSINSRTKRQTSGGISDTGFGVSHTGTILNNDNHKLDGSAFASKQFHGPLTTGGSLDYSHKPTGSGLSVGTSNTRGFGNDVSAQGRYNFFQSRDGRTTGSVTGEYGRHFGGPGGTSRPNYGAFVNFQHRF